MLFGFFIREGRTVCLEPHSQELAKFPILCTTASKVVPNIVQDVTRVNLNKTDTKTEELQPLFYAMYEGKVVDPEALPKDVTFELIFYSEITDAKNLFEKEYSQSIIPMKLCCDMTGYFLGTIDAEGSCKFTRESSISAQTAIQPSQSPPKQSLDTRFFILKAEKNFSNEKCFGKGIQFGSQKIYIKQLLA